MENFHYVVIATLGIPTIVTAVVSMISIARSETSRLQEDVILRIMRKAPPAEGLSYGWIRHFCIKADVLPQDALDETLTRLVGCNALYAYTDGDECTYRFTPHHPRPF